MKKKKKKGVNPVLAVGLLLAGVAVAGNSLMGLSSGPSAPSGPAPEIVEMPEMDSGVSQNTAAEAIRWQDLLAEHGSFDGRSSVRVAFSVLEEARLSMAAPGGETAAVASYWQGEDPPEMELGVVMISAKSRRVVLGGRVVGIGEEHMGVVVQTIERDEVVTLWGVKVLTYDMQNAYPREFRAELARRQREQAEKGAAQVDGAVISDPEVKDASWAGPVLRSPGTEQRNSKVQERRK